MEGIADECRKRSVGGWGGRSGRARQRVMLLPFVPFHWTGCGVVIAGDDAFWTLSRKFQTRLLAPRIGAA